MNNYHKIMQDELNYALLPNIYLEEVKKETNKEKRFNLLKKYFTEHITKNLYQNMDLLNATQIDFDQFKNMYVMIAKELFLNILLAVETLVNEKQHYRLDTSQIDVCNNILGSTSEQYDDRENEYSICQTYLETSHDHISNDN